MTLQRTTVDPPADDDTRPTSFAEFVSEQQVALVAAALGLTRNVEDARDLAQEALTKAFEHWDEVVTHPNPDAWVRRVMLNLHGDGHRRRAARHKVLRLVRVRQTNRPAVSADASLDTIEFWEAVALLTRRQREVIVLRCANEASTAEISAVLELTEATVRSHLATARIRLAELLEVDTQTEKGMQT